MTSESSSSSGSSAGLALGLVALAGAATFVGAGVVYVPRLVSLANATSLAVSLGLSAGVMVFVSFAEIFHKSKQSFINSGKNENVAYCLAMVCFFAGIVIMLVSKNTEQWYSRRQNCEVWK